MVFGYTAHSHFSDWIVSSVHGPGNKSCTFTLDRSQTGVQYATAINSSQPVGNWQHHGFEKTPRFLPVSQASPCSFRRSPSTLRSGSIFDPPTSPPPSNSSPALKSTQRPPSPDYFDDFEYTKEMDEDFRKIDLAAESALGHGIHQPFSQNLPDSQSSSSQKVWVVFRGRIPGIYNDP